MPSGVVHGRVAALYKSSDSASTNLGSEWGYTQSYTVNLERELDEITKINQNSKEYLEGLITGTLDASGFFRSGDSIGIHTAVKHFTKFNDSNDSSDTGDTGFAAAEDGDMYLHAILKPIDTGSTGDEAKGAKLVMKLLPSNMSFEVSGDGVETWSYNGQVNGDILYAESTATERGFPTKAV
jgi:hypothetical protein